MKKNLYLGVLLVSTMLSSPTALATGKLKVRDIEIQSKDFLDLIKQNRIESVITPVVITIANKHSGTQYTTLAEAIKCLAELPEDQTTQVTEELFQPIILSLIDAKWGKGFTSSKEFEGFLSRVKSGDVKLLDEYKGTDLGTLLSSFDAKELQDLAHNLIDNEPLDVESFADYSDSFEGQEHLKTQIDEITSKIDHLKKRGASQEEIENYLDQYRNSPEFQELLKLQAKEITNNIDHFKKLGASQEEIEDYLVGFIAEAEDLGLLVDPDTVKESKEFTPLQKQDTASTDSLLAASAQVSLVEYVIDNRLVNTTGIASGNEPLSYGMWVRGMFSQAKQGAYKLTPGYKLNQHGATIGFDLGEEEGRLGIAYSFVDSKVNSKNTGIKDKLKSHIGTIYGLYQFPNNIFIDGQIRYGVSKITKNRDNGNLSKDVSSSKPKGTILGGKLELGYDYELADKIHLIPTIGVSSDQVKIKGYKEKGDGLNRDVAQRTASKTSALVGFRVSKAIENGGLTMIPELHANLIYAVQSKNPNTKVTLFEGIEPMVIPSAKIAKASYKIGGSVKFIKLQKIDLGMGYDLGLGKKFRSHSGYLNARYNF